MSGLKRARSDDSMGGGPPSVDAEEVRESLLATDSPTSGGRAARGDTPSASKRAASDAGVMDDGLNALELRSAASTTAPSPAAASVSVDEPTAMDVSPSPQPPVPEPSEQLATIATARRAGMQAGQDWVIVDRTWFRRFEAACSGGSATDKELADLTPADVGPLSNAHLADASGHLRIPPPVEDVDCVFVPLPAWQKLRDWCVGALCPAR